MSATSTMHPGLIGIGGQKCGTSWVANVLASHPRVWMPIKEVHYFDRYLDRGDEWYLGQLQPPNGDIVVMEMTPDYLHDPACGSHIAALLPDTRLLCILRDPIQRAVSQYKFQVMKFGERRSLQDFLAANDDALARGEYARQLEAFAWHHNRELLDILIFEEIIADPAALKQRLGVIAGLDPGGFDDAVDTSPSVRPRFPVAKAAISRLTRTMRDAGLAGMVEAAKRVVGGPIDRVLLSRDRVRVDLSDDLVMMLRDRYLSDIMALESLLGRSLSCWPTHPEYRDAVV
jgi:hypothetical protein